MQNIFFTLLVWSYGLVGALGLAGYFITLKDLHFKKQMCANLHSYFIWTITGFITFLYSVFVLNDLLFQIVAAFNFLSCLFILVLTIRYKFNS